VYLLSCCNIDKHCIANSLVGRIIRHFEYEFKEPVESFCFQIRSIIGRRKAAVLPEPVIEEARTSRPVMIAGIVISWTSVGCENSRS